MNKNERLERFINLFIIQFLELEGNMILFFKNLKSIELIFDKLIVFIIFILI